MDFHGDKGESEARGLGGGDSSPGGRDRSPLAEERERIRRERDSLDDFEHLDRDASPSKDRALTPEEAAFGSPARSPVPSAAPAHTHTPATAPAVQAFLDTEREELFVEPSRLPAPLLPSPAPVPAPISVPEPLMEPPVPLHTPAPTAPPPTPTPAAPAPATPVPTLAPSATVPTPAPDKDKETVYSDSREELSEDEQERPPPPKPQAHPPVQIRPPVPAPAPVPAAAAPIRTQTPQMPIVAARPLLQQLALDALFAHPERLHPHVEALVYWRSPAKSGAALGGGLALLVALACCSLISVLAYLALLSLSATIAFRLYKTVLQAVQKTSEGHPFKEFLEADLSVSPEKAQELAVLGTAHLNAAVSELRRLFLVEDLVDSLKFAVMLWCLTYVGAWFNGMTLIIIGYVGLFTLPKIYETNKTQIDANLEIVSAKFQEFTNKVRAAIPIGKKADSDKDK